MREEMLTFIIWASMGVAFVIFGIYCFFSKKAKPFGFWANAKTFPVSNVKKYNQALGKLWMVFGMLFALIGLPILEGENSPGIILMILGAMVLSIGAMAVYVVVIERKYRK